MINNKELIDELVKQYGSPLYVFRKDDFIDNYLFFNDCMKKEYANYQLAYSYKTNYAPYICKIVKQLGGYAEVVSDMEYKVAKKIGYNDKHIVYNGPTKGPLLEEVVTNGCLVNVDNMTELNRIVELSQKSNTKIHIGLRLNINIGQSYVSRFGFDTENGTLEQALDIIKINNIVVDGIHCHLGQNRTVESWNKRSKTMVEIIDKYFDAKSIKYIDLGSGMFAVMEESLAKQFGDNIPTFSDYAKAIATPINDYFVSNKPMLLTEPGTTLINSYVDFIGTVDSIKINNNQQFVTMRCSKHNLGEICELKQLPIRIIHNNKNELIKCNDAIIAGYTCLQHDKMYRNLNEEIAVGDYIVFGNVGGYTNVSKPPFIEEQCAMVSLDKNGKVEVIKRKETFDDVFSTYVF